MPKIEFEFDKIPHGHGFSFKKGIADALLNNDKEEDKAKFPKTHSASYQRGVDTGMYIKSEIASYVKD